MRIAHTVTIVSEMVTGQFPWYQRARRRYGLDTRLNLALGRGMTSSDYVQAQRMRARVRARFARVLEDVDAIVTPSTGCTAPLAPTGAAALRHGESNLPLLDKIMRFVHAANLTGYPAISFPAGYDDAGLPVGMQALGRPWEEHLLLRIARVAEPLVPRRAPKVHRTLLG